MAPLIDVVFLLLLFFMLTSTFLDPAAIDLSLPTSRTATDTDTQPMTVAVDAEGAVFLDGEPIALEALADAVRQRVQADPDTTIALRSDATLAVQRMIEVVDEIRAGGGSRLAVMTDPAAPRREDNGTTP